MRLYYAVASAFSTPEHLQMTPELFSFAQKRRALGLRMSQMLSDILWLNEFSRIRLVVSKALTNILFSWACTSVAIFNINCNFDQITSCRLTCWRANYILSRVQKKLKRKIRNCQYLRLVAKRRSFICRMLFAREMCSAIDCLHLYANLWANKCSRFGPWPNNHICYLLNYLPLCANVYYFWERKVMENNQNSYRLKGRCQWLWSGKISGLSHVSCNILQCVMHNWHLIALYIP